jgi:hypothetical protein
VKLAAIRLRGQSSFIKNITKFSIHGDKKPRQPQVHRALERLPATMN